MTPVVRIVSRDQFRELHGGNRGHALRDPMLYWTEFGGFTWECPMCGRAQFAELGPNPVGGWHGEQRWVNTGTLNLPTLMPSLGCPGLQDHTCTGHFWLKDGVFGPA